MQEAQDLLEDLENNASHMWDGSDYAALEKQFGLQPGAGPNFLSLLGQARQALEAPILLEFTSRIAGQ